MRIRWALLAAAVLAGAAAAPADGAVRTFGSDLSREADRTEARGADTVYWQPAGAGVGTVVPEDGEITEIRLRGFAESDTPPATVAGGGETIFHFQALTPSPDGSVQVRMTSDAFDVPNRQAANAGTVTPYALRRFCVRAGEHVAFNNVGGYGPAYPYGTPMRLFATVRGSTVSRFTGAGQTNTGAVFRADEGSAVRDAELLMQMTLATGDDRRPQCGGPQPAGPPSPLPDDGGGGGKGDGDGDGTPGTTRPPARISSGSGARVRRGRATFSVYCTKVAACRGDVVLRARGKRLSRKGFAISAGETETVRMRLSRAGRRLLSRGGGRLKATAIVTAEPGGDGDVQRLRVTLRRR